METNDQKVFWDEHWMKAMAENILHNPSTSNTSSTWRFTLRFLICLSLHDIGVYTQSSFWMNNRKIQKRL